MFNSALIGQAPGSYVFQLDEGVEYQLQSDIYLY